MNEVMFLQLADDHHVRDFELFREKLRMDILTAFRMPWYLLHPEQRTDMAAYFQCTCEHYCEGCDCICHNGSPA